MVGLETGAMAVAVVEVGGTTPKNTPLQCRRSALHRPRELRALQV